ncbi:hypothetical protein E2C01_036250 [Portunus trituberculatus]|uniref:Uncharacterized protein n=1 Tax=Portunus trituberculatus TaxID=210409 RepID=A0A5B7FAQ4_PORTR|nr:hypothetical protein [Portunus trituberculatus]
MIQWPPGADDHKTGRRGLCIGAGPGGVGRNGSDLHGQSCGVSLGFVDDEKLQGKKGSKMAHCVTAASWTALVVSPRFSFVFLVGYLVPCQEDAALPVLKT